MRISCPNCQMPFDVADELIGHKGLCPGCNTKFVIPASPNDPAQILQRGAADPDQMDQADGAAAEPPQVIPRTQAQKPRRRRKRASASTAKIGVITAVGVLVIGVVIGKLISSEKAGTESEGDPLASASTTPTPDAAGSGGGEPGSVIGALPPAAREELVYAAFVQPIFNIACVGCHGQEKQKGELRLDSFAELMKGGDTGPGVVPRIAGESELIARITLPLSDDDHMPPEGKRQLAADQIAVLKWWAEMGAGEKLTVAQAAPGPDIELALARLRSAPLRPPSRPLAGEPAPAPESPSQRAIDELRRAGLNVMPLAQSDSRLSVTCLNVAATFDDAQLARMAPFAERIVWLNLARTQITDDSLAVVGKMENLTRLHLENTEISDAGLRHLQALKNLEYLNLYATNVSDAGLANIVGMDKLANIYLWQTKVTPDGARELMARLPNLVVNLGSDTQL